MGSAQDGVRGRKGVEQFAEVIGAGDVAASGEGRPGDLVGVRVVSDLPEAGRLELVVSSMLGGEVVRGCRAGRPGDVVVEVAPGCGDLAAGGTGYLISGSVTSRCQTLPGVWARCRAWSAWIHP